MAYLELLFCFALLYEHWLEHIIDLLWWSVLAIANTNAGQQDELFNALLCCCLNQVDVALYVTEDFPQSTTEQRWPP